MTDQHNDAVAQARSELGTFDRISRRSAEALLAEIERTEAALREWCEFIGFAGRDFVKRFVEEEMRKRGLWRDPEPKEESDGE